MAIGDRNKTKLKKCDKGSFLQYIKFMVYYNIMLIVLCGMYFAEIVWQLFVVCCFVSLIQRDTGMCSDWHVSLLVITIF